MDKIAILIPCYNEGLTIRKVVTDAKTYLPEAAVYVYDNNSTDNTVQEATEAGAIVRYEHKQGKGNVVRAMFEQIDALCYIMVDGDDTYELSTLPEMAKRVLEDHDDMVVGDRLSGAYFTENKRPFHNFGNSLVRFFINKLFHAHITDMMTGYRAFSYEFVKTFPLKSNGFETETEMSVFSAVHHLRLSSFTCGYRDRPAGSYSKLNTFEDGFKVLRLIGHLFAKNRPWAYSLLLGSLPLALGLGFLIPEGLSLMLGGSFYSLGGLIASHLVFWLGAAILLWGAVSQSKRNREFSLFRLLYEKVHREKGFH